MYKFLFTLFRFVLLFVFFVSLSVSLYFSVVFPGSFCCTGKISFVVNVSDGFHGDVWRKDNDHESE